MPAKQRTFQIEEARLAPARRKKPPAADAASGVAADAGLEPGFPLRRDPGGALSSKAVVQLQRKVGNQAVMRMLSGQKAVQRAPSPGLIQRETTVEGDPGKLDYFVQRFGELVTEFFRQSTAEQVDKFVSAVNAAWRGAYEDGGDSLTEKAAKDSVKFGDLLKLLGKAAPQQQDYQRLSTLLTDTFTEDTEHRYEITTRKPDHGPQYPAGTKWWLDELHGNGLIEAEDKEGDQRAQNSQLNNIVKTNADTADTATALYEIKAADSDKDEINKDERSWELHAHVKQNGAVAFAHTKADNQHYSVVNEWFAENIDVEDRKWTKP